MYIYMGISLQIEALMGNSSDEFDHDLCHCVTSPE